MILSVIMKSFTISRTGIKKKTTPGTQNTTGRED